MRTDVRPLRPEEAHQAYALLHLVDGSCTLKDWLSFVRDLENPRPHIRVHSGVMVAHGPDGGILGLFVYKTSVARPASRQLIVHHFVAFDPFGPGVTAAALLKAMERLAVELSCEAIRLELSPSHLRTQLGELDILPVPVAGAGYCAAGLNALKSLAIQDTSDRQS